MVEPRTEEPRRRDIPDGDSIGEKTELSELKRLQEVPWGQRKTREGDGIRIDCCILFQAGSNSGDTAGSFISNKRIVVTLLS